MSSETRWVWRVLGCLGVLGSAWSAVGSLDAYMRHRASSDGVGFAMGMTFLRFWFAPATAIALLLSVGPARPPEAVHGLAARLARLSVVIVLAAGAGFFLWFPMFVLRVEAQDLPPGDVVPWRGWLYYRVLEPGSLIAFAVLLAGSAAATLRPSIVRSPWFKAMLVGVGVVGVITIVDLLAESIQGWILVLPIAALVLVVGWTLRAIHRAPAEDSAAG